jgi:hypothetical protein
MYLIPASRATSEIGAAIAETEPVVSHLATDLELMVAVQDARGCGLEELYRRHASLLRAVIYRILHHDADADDVLQDVSSKSGIAPTVSRPRKGSRWVG